MIKTLGTHVTQFRFVFIGSSKRYTDNHSNCQHRLEIIDMRHLCKSSNFLEILNKTIKQKKSSNITFI